MLGFMSSFASTILQPIGAAIAKGSYYARVAFSAIIGGTVSVIGGGKFANGAVTSAFQFMYNENLHDASKHGYNSEKEAAIAGLKVIYKQSVENRIEMCGGVYKKGNKYFYLIELDNSDATVSSSFLKINPLDGLSFTATFHTHPSNFNIRFLKDPLSYGLLVQEQKLYTEVFSRQDMLYQYHNRNDMFVGTMNGSLLSSYYSNYGDSRRYVTHDVF